MSTKLLNLIDKTFILFTSDNCIIAIVLIFFVIFVDTVLTPSSVGQINLYWGETNFTLQMAIVLLLGYIVSISVFVLSLLLFLASFAKKAAHAIIIYTLTASVASLLNCGFSPVEGTFIF